MSGSQWHTLAVVVIAVCWGIWALVWVGGALYNARRGPQARTRRRPLGAVSLLAAALAVLALRMLPAHDWRSVTLDIAAVRIVGMSVLVVGTVFTLWARVALGTMWSASVVVKERHRLRTDGPYGITRHPIYTGMLAMLVGSALADGLGRWLVVVAVVCVVLAAKIRDEERLLSETFPHDYARYRRRVPLLVPGPKRR